MTTTSSTSTSNISDQSPIAKKGRSILSAIADHESAKKLKLDLLTHFVELENITKSLLSELAKGIGILKQEGEDPFSAMSEALKILQGPVADLVADLAARLSEATKGEEEAPLPKRANSTNAAMRAFLADHDSSSAPTTKPGAKKRPRQPSDPTLKTPTGGGNFSSPPAAEMPKQVPTAPDTADKPSTPKRAKTNA